jgi:AAA domain
MHIMTTAELQAQAAALGIGIPAVVVEPEIQTAPTEPGPLTREMAVDLVQKWVAEDAEYELSERRTFGEMVETLQDDGDTLTTKLSVSDLKQIVSQYAPDAPTRATQQNVQPVPNYPSELKSLVESGVAVYEDDVWLVNRCDKCGQFKSACCGRITRELAVRDDNTLTSFGRQAVGLDPIKPPRPPQTLEQVQQRWTQESWWSGYRGVDELEGNGTIKMYIENFLPEGTTIICGLPKEGKSFVALSIAKALTSGKPLFGRPKFSVPEIVPVLYLAAESGDGALKLRCEKMGITKDKTRFIARTLSQGPMFGLDDENIQNAVKAMRPVVILETLIRFNDGENEDSSTENRKLAEAIFRLIAWGAKAVIGIHHSRKDLNKASPTKEAAVRGSGDGLAMVDAVWLVMQDEHIFQRGKGPNQIEIVGWGRDFNPVPMTLALTKKAGKDTPADKLFAPGIVSLIDSVGDLEWIDKRIVFEQAQESAESLKQTVERLVIESPAITLKDLTHKTGQKEWKVRKALKQLGYSRGQGDNSTTRWVRKP